MLAAVALGLFLGVPGPAKAQYDFTTIDVPGSTRTAVNGNSTHAIAGEFDDADGNTHGFVLSKGVYTPIDVPGAVFTSVNGINANGELSGIYVDAGGTYPRLFLEQGRLHHARPARLDPHAGRASSTRKARSWESTAMPARQRHGFIWSKGVFTTFDVPGSAAPSGTVGLGINDHGEVVGTTWTGMATRRGFVLSKGVYTTLDVPGAALTVAEGINNAGQIAGLYFDADGNEHGFVLSNGVYTTIDVPGSVCDRGLFDQRERRDRGILR